MEAAIRTLIEKDAIQDVLTELFTATDAREWERVRACFAPRVLFDMTSLAGGSPTQLAPEQITGAWEEGLRHLDAVHHQIGNLRIVVDGDAARASCYGIASHHLASAPGKKTRTFVGSYTFHLVKLDGRWRVDLFRFDCKYITGNVNLVPQEV